MHAAARGLIFWPIIVGKNEEEANLGSSYHCFANKSCIDIFVSMCHFCRSLNGFRSNIHLVMTLCHRGRYDLKSLLVSAQSVGNKIAI